MAPSFQEITKFRITIVSFLRERLRLEINPNHDRIIVAREGVRFLGVYVYPNRRQLNRRNWRRSQHLLNLLNYSSYRGLVQVHETARRRKEFTWRTHAALTQLF